MAGRLTREELVEDAKNEGKILGGALGVGGGGALLKNIHEKGHVSGVRKFYHNAPAEFVDSIKNEGLKKSKAVDPNNLTNNVLQKQVEKGFIKPEDIADKVYLAKNKKVADNVGKARTLRMGGNQKTFGVNIPIEDLKGMTSHSNPELMGTKNSKEWLEKLKKIHSGTPEGHALNPNDPLQQKLYGKIHKNLGKGTKVLGNDISAKYIKGSKHYKGQTLKGLGKYIKNNPGRFAKGVGMAGAGTAGVLGGAALLGKGVKDNNDLYKRVGERENKERRERIQKRMEDRQKQAFEIVNYEFEKIAKELKGRDLRDAMIDNQDNFIEFVQNNRKKVLPSGKEAMKALGKGALMSAAAGGAVHFGGKALKVDPLARSLVLGAAVGTPLTMPLSKKIKENGNSLLKEKFGDNAHQMGRFDNNLQRAYTRNLMRDSKE